MKLKSEYYHGYKIEIKKLNTWYEVKVIKSNKLIVDLSGNFGGKYNVIQTAKNYINSIFVEGEIDNYVSKLKVPVGFTLSTTKNDDFEKRYKLLLKSDKILIEVRVGVNRYFSPEYIHLEGSVNYRVGDTWWTFDRRGVGPSFYTDNKEYPDINILITEQINRARSKISEHVKEPRVVVPGTGIYITDVKRIDIRKRLLKGEEVNLFPSGMGTGYTFYSGSNYKNKRELRHARYAGHELSKFFGVDDLLLETFDYD